MIRPAVPLLTGVAVLAAPRDLLGSSLPQRRTILGVTDLVAVLMSGVKLIELYYPFTPGVLSDIGPLWAGVLRAGVLAIALILGTRNRLTVAGVAVAVLPSTLQVTVQLTPPVWLFCSWSCSAARCPSFARARATSGRPRRARCSRIVSRRRRGVQARCA
ncbi:hypothetical protein [Streptomyces ossamyceticus]|uniref:hypothetical protein n=1 Tax=Streptomyces ossamyceticus TaxID=249581 RepID=UPI0006E45A7E|nr:hypothetical protein [Streptomyces ossamyceticus]